MKTSRKRTKIDKNGVRPKKQQKNNETNTNTFFRSKKTKLENNNKIPWEVSLNYPKKPNAPGASPGAADELEARVVERTEQGCRAKKATAKDLAVGQNNPIGT